MLRNIDLYIVTEVSGQPIGPVFKGQAFRQVVQKLWCLTTNQCCVTFQKRGELSHIVVEP